MVMMVMVMMMVMMMMMMMAAWKAEKIAAAAVMMMMLVMVMVMMIRGFPCRTHQLIISNRRSLRLIAMLMVMMVMFVLCVVKNIVLRIIFNRQSVALYRCFFIIIRRMNPLGQTRRSYFFVHFMIF